MSERILESVLRTATQISSSHDRANLLEAIAASPQGDGHIASALRGCDGRHGDRSTGIRALAALVRSEARQ